MVDAKRKELLKDEERLLELGEKCVMREDPFKEIYEDFWE